METLSTTPMYGVPYWSMFTIMPVLTYRALRSSTLISTTILVVSAMVMPWPLWTSAPSVRLQESTVPEMGAVALYLPSSSLAVFSFSWAAFRASSLEVISSSVFSAPSRAMTWPAFTSP